MIVAVLPGGTPDEVRADLAALAQAPGFARGAIAAEVRLDLMSLPDPAVFRGAPLQTIATCRRPRDGGRFRGSEEERLALLRAAAEAGAIWVDVEAEVVHQLALPPATRRIVSVHDFEAVPGDLPGLVRRLLEPSVAMVKVAARARTLLDLVALAGVARIEPGRVTAIAIGSIGMPTRWLFDRVGNPWGYFAYRPSDGRAAPELDQAGVPALDDLVNLYRAGPSLPPPVGAFAVLGEYATNSIGPLVFNRVFRDLAIPATYVPLTAPSLTGLREAIRLYGLRGLSVTTPHKEEVVKFAEAVHPRVRATGAANTLVLENGRWVAHNTDVDGVSVPVRRALHAAGRNPAGLRALVVGAGGAGRSAVAGLRAVGCQVTLLGRDPRRAADASAALAVPLIASSAIDSGSFDLVVNATPAGGLRDPSGRAVDLGWLAPGGIVFESNYRPRETPLMAQARAAGFTVIGGDEMYLAQAVAQLHLFWGGLDQVDERMKKAVEWAFERIGSR